MPPDTRQPAATPETLDEVKERLPGVLDQIIQDARLALVLGRINELPRTEPRVYKRFSRTHAGRVFVLMRQETLHLQLLALHRLWDQKDRALSIPRAVGWLRRRDVRQDIVRRRQAPHLGRADEPNFSDANGYTEEDRAIIRRNGKIDAAHAATEVVNEINRLSQAETRYLASDLHERLKVRRHRYIAHSLEITTQEIRAQEQGRSIDPIAVGDEDDILAITLPMVRDLNRLMRDLHLEFDSIKDVWSVYAEDYWLRFSGTPKRRRSLRDLPPTRGT